VYQVQEILVLVLRILVAAVEAAVVLAKTVAQVLVVKVL
jgi:hypothetical protein|tara:strand:+ start:511 stop:627 length:117 start_codon:yes stop_codon:yes gene_type:complete